MEVELKFQVPPAQRARLRKAVATARARRTRLQAVYADTADQRLAAAGLALRLRKEGRAWVQTLKGRGDGLMQRLEHEVALPAQRGVPVLDPLRHAGSAAGAALMLALGGGELHPVYRTDIQRLHRRVRHGGALIEIAYDHGHILAAGQRAVVDELEFELLRGPPSALVELASRWAVRHGLWWDVRTKSERGYSLAHGLQRVPAVALPLQDAQGRTLLQVCLAQALPNAAELASGTGTPEHLRLLDEALQALRRLLPDQGIPGPLQGSDVGALVRSAAFTQGLLQALARSLPAA